MDNLFFHFTMNIEIKAIKSYKDLDLFWDMFYEYINDFLENCSEDNEILNYFLSEEYKKEVINLNKQDFNPLEIVFFTLNHTIIGFATYIIFVHQNGKSVILEYSILPEFRHKNYGTLAFLKLQKKMIKEGAKLIELTPTNNRNKLFWKNNGFDDSSLFYSDGRIMLSKTL